VEGGCWELPGGQRAWFFIAPLESARTYGSLATAASQLTPPTEVKLKDAKSFTLIGKPTRRLDTPSKTNGSAQFGLDVSLPGMLTAVVAPAAGIRRKSGEG